jgi:uncharacterized membrane protein
LRALLGTGPAPGATPAVPPLVATVPPPAPIAGEPPSLAAGVPPIAPPEPAPVSAPVAPPVIGAPAVEPPPVAVPPIAAADRAASFDWEAIIAGRWLFRVGLAAVGVGVSYFLKLAIDNDWIGPLGQVALGILMGAGLLAGSAAVLRRGYAFFADGLAGLGAAILYLSIWAGSSYYGLFPQGVGLAAMSIVTAAMLAIALGRDSQRIAVLALLGGFLTPVLLSTGRDAQLELFSYLTLLNAALLPIAWRRKWRAIELPAFAFTQLYFWGWYGRFYADDKLIITAVFALVFFAEFAVVPLLRSLRVPAIAEEHVVLVPVNAAVCLAAFGALLWPEHRWVLTMTALGLGALHLMAANAMPARDAGTSPVRLLFAGVALTLITVAVPLRLDGRWITIAWAIEGAVLMWTSFQVRVVAMRALAFAVLAIAIWRSLVMPQYDVTFLFTARALAELVTVVCGGAALWFAHRARERVTAGERLPFGILAVAVNLLALKALTTEVGLFFRPREFAIATFDPRLAEGLTISVLWALYASALVAIGMRTRLAAWRWQGLALFGATTVKVFLVDLAFLSGVYRVLSSIMLGVVLLVVSFFYQRRLAAARSAPAGEAKA